MLQIIIAVVLLILLILALIYTIKEIIHSPIIILIFIIFFISFSFGGDVIENIIISIVFEMIFMKTKEKEALRKQLIIDRKVNKYNDEIKIFNKANPQSQKKEISFNEDLYNKFHDFSFSTTRIFGYCCLIIPPSFFKLAQKLNLISLKLSEGWNFCNQFVNYYIPKFNWCMGFLFIITLISLFVILSINENKIFSKFLKKRRADSINNIKYDNGELVFNDDQIIYIGDYTEEELKILNNDNNI